MNGPAIVGADASRQVCRAALRAHTWRETRAGYAAGLYGRADRATKRRASAAVVHATWRSVNA